MSVPREELERLVQVFVHGEAGIEELRELERLLKASDADSRLLASMLADSRMIAALFRAESDERFVPETLAALNIRPIDPEFVARVLQETQKPRRTERRLSSRWIRLPAFLAAAASVVGIAGALVFFGSAPKRGPSELARQPQPGVETGTREHGVAPLVLEGLPISPSSVGSKDERGPIAAPARSQKKPIVLESPDLDEKPQRAPPAPAPKGPSPAPLPNDTVLVTVQIERSGGEAVIATGTAMAPAKAGQALLAGQGLRTIGPGSWAILRYSDGTRLALGADSTISRFDGKNVFATQGTFAADVAKQRAGERMAFLTPQARAEIVGTRLDLVVQPVSTRLDVREGRVQLTRKEDGASVEVTEGFYAVAEPQMPLQVRPLIDQKRVDRAVARGVEYLKKSGSPAMNGSPNCHELLLLTFLHAGVPAGDPCFRKLFKEMMASELTATYNVSLLAILLEEMDRVKYQDQIYKCAQFLVDNQGFSGQWDYGQPTQYEKFPTAIAVFESGRPQERAARPKSSPKRVLVRKIIVKKNRDGSGKDSSTSMYAALGLRACHDAGIVIPPEVIARADKWWRQTQQGAEASKNDIVPTGYAPVPRGWGYGSEGGQLAPSGSMTAGGIGSLAIYGYLKDPDGKIWKQDMSVLGGIEWLARHFSVTENPEQPKWFFYYYLYALERAGVLFGTERFGGHEWYPEGAQVLLDSQRPDGSWGDAGAPHDHAEWDTCFAILFLKRATQPLEYIVTGDAHSLRKRLQGKDSDQDPIVVDPIDEPSPTAPKKK